MFNFLNESIITSVEQQEALENKRKLKSSTLWFNNLSAAFLFAWEESGQISDGKYENAGPWDHWRWLKDYVVLVDEDYKQCCVRRYPSNCEKYWHHIDHPKKYNINDFIKNKELDCITYRMLCYGRLGKCLPNTQASFDRYNSEKMMTACEYLGTEKKYEYVEDFLENLSDHCSWIKSIDDLLTIFSQDVYDNYYKTEYSIKDLKKDLQSMDKTVNTIYVIAY